VSPLFNSFIAGKKKIVFTNAWIIDFTCFGHVTFNVRQIKNLKPSSQKIISRANDNKSTIIGERNVSISNYLNLDIVVVPSLKYNLLSHSQITKTLLSIVIFLAQHLCF